MERREHTTACQIPGRKQAKEPVVLKTEILASQKKRGIIKEIGKMALKLLLNILCNI